VLNETFYNTEMQNTLFVIYFLVVLKVPVILMMLLLFYAARKEGGSGDDDGGGKRRPQPKRPFDSFERDFARLLLKKRLSEEKKSSQGVS
jgi:hypothetical protein